MNKKIIGLDEWVIHTSLTRFLQMAHRHDWVIYDVHEEHHQLCFYASPFQRHDIERVYETARLRRTTGAIGLFMRNLRRPSRVLALLLSCLLWFGLSKTVFAVEIRGDKQESEELIRKTLVKMDKVPPFTDHGVKDVKAKLKKQLENDIAWLEIVKKGSRYVIYYTPKEFAEIEELSHKELIARKDAVIAGFDLQHGNKMFKINDYVKKGDILVSNIMPDSFQKPQELYVKGKVYGYTWNQIDVMMPRSRLPKAFDFYQLLFEARLKISDNFLKGDRIQKENILQFEEDAGTIRLSVLYTVYEDISTPR